MASYRDRGRTHNLFRCCFRPGADAMDDGSYSRRLAPATTSGDPVFAYITVGGKEGAVLSTILPTTFSKESGAGGGEGVRRKKVTNRGLSGVLKSILLETSLAKKIRDRRRGSRRPNSALSSKIERILNSVEHAENPKSRSGPRSGKKHDRQSANSDQKPSSSSSSSSSSAYSSAMASLNPTPPSEAAKSTELRGKDGCREKKEVVGHGCSNSVGMYLLLVLVLLVLVWCGKLCAIVFTSTFLIAVPRRLRGSATRNSPETMSGELPCGAGSAEHRKRVILAGLLQRKR